MPGTKGRPKRRKPARRRIPARKSIPGGGVGGTVTVEVPKDALKHVQKVIAFQKQGKRVSVVATDEELTTTEAADILNVSRPYVVRLLDDGTIPSHKTGKHRRVKLRDVLAYRSRNDLERLKVLAELSALDREYGLE